MGKDEKLERTRISLDALDQSKSVDQEDYRVRLKESQLRPLNLQRALMEMQGVRSQEPGVRIGKGLTIQDFFNLEFFRSNEIASGYYNY